MRNPVTAKKDWDKKGISEEFQLLFCRLIFNCCVDRQPGQKCSHYLREIDTLGKETRHCQDRKHKNKCIFVVFHLF
jgi:hypothetical protein